MAIRTLTRLRSGQINQYKRTIAYRRGRIVTEFGAAAVQGRPFRGRGAVSAGDTPQRETRSIPVGGELVALSDGLAVGAADAYFPVEVIAGNDRKAVIHIVSQIDLDGNPPIGAITFQNTHLAGFPAVRNPPQGETLPIGGVIITRQDTDPDQHLVIGNRTVDLPDDLPAGVYLVALRGRIDTTVALTHIAVGVDFFQNLRVGPASTSLNLSPALGQNVHSILGEITFEGPGILVETAAHLNDRTAPLGRREFLHPENEFLFYDEPALAPDADSPLGSFPVGSTAQVISEDGSQTRTLTALFGSGVSLQGFFSFADFYDFAPAAGRGDVPASDASAAAPPAPTVTAVVSSNNEIRFTLTRVDAFDLSHFEIDRSLEFADDFQTIEVEIGGVPNRRISLDATQVADRAGIVPGSRYIYRAFQVDTLGNRSAATSFIGAVASEPDATLPPTPVVIQIQSLSSTEVSMQWSHGVATQTPDDTTGFVIRRSVGPALTEGGVVIQRITGVSDPRYTFFDTGLTSGETYTYTINAVDGPGNESEDNPRIVTTFPIRDDVENNLSFQVELPPGAPITNAQLPAARRFRAGQDITIAFDLLVSTATASGMIFFVGRSLDDPEPRNIAVWLQPGGVLSFGAWNPPSTTDSNPQRIGRYTLPANEQAFRIVISVTTGTDVVDAVAGMWVDGERVVDLEAVVTGNAFSLPIGGTASVAGVGVQIDNFRFQLPDEYNQDISGASISNFHVYDTVPPELGLNTQLFEVVTGDIEEFREQGGSSVDGRLTYLLTRPYNDLTLATFDENGQTLALGSGGFIRLFRLAPGTNTRAQLLSINTDAVVTSETAPAIDSADNVVEANDVLFVEITQPDPNSWPPAFRLYLLEGRSLTGAAVVLIYDVLRVHRASSERFFTITGVTRTPAERLNGDFLPGTAGARTCALAFSVRRSLNDQLTPEGYVFSTASERGLVVYLAAGNLHMAIVDADAANNVAYAVPHGLAANERARFIINIVIDSAGQLQFIVNADYFDRVEPGPFELGRSTLTNVGSRWSHQSDNTGAYFPAQAGFVPMLPAGASALVPPIPATRNGFGVASDLVAYWRQTIDINNLETPQPDIENGRDLTLVAEYRGERTGVMDVPVLGSLTDPNNPFLLFTDDTLMPTNVTVVGGYVGGAIRFRRESTTTPGTFENLPGSSRLNRNGAPLAMAFPMNVPLFITDSTPERTTDLVIVTGRGDQSEPLQVFRIPGFVSV